MRTAKYPLHTLAIDEAIDVPPGVTDARAVAQLCYAAGKRLGRSFSYATLPDGGFEIARNADPVAVEYVKRPRRAPPVRGLDAALDEVDRRLRGQK